MAGSEQINFMIASNYSAAKMSLEQFKQQVLHLSQEQQQYMKPYQHARQDQALTAGSISPKTNTPFNSGYQYQSNWKHTSTINS